MIHNCMFNVATGAFYATDTGSTHRSTIIGSGSGCGYVMVRTTNGSWVVETLVEIGEWEFGKR